MLKHLTLLLAVFLPVFITGCSEYTEIFIEEVNILPTGDSGDVSWLDDIDIPLDDILINGWDDDASCPAPDPEDDTPPTMIESTVTHGEIVTDPDLLNEGGIYVLFDEDVYGSIELQFEEDGSPVGWTGIVEGNTAELYPTEGNEVDFDTLYVVEITVADATGNISYYNMTFATAPQPEPEN